MHCNTLSHHKLFVAIHIYWVTYFKEKNSKFKSSEKLLRNLLIFPSFPLGCFPETLMLASLSQDFQQTHKLAILCWIEHWRYKWQWAKNSFGQLIIFDEAFLEDKAHFKGRYIHNLRTQRRYFHMEFLCAAQKHIFVARSGWNGAHQWRLLKVCMLSSSWTASHLIPSHLIVDRRISLCRIQLLLQLNNFKVDPLRSL